jgi:hypothetical protein
LADYNVFLYLYVRLLKLYDLLVVLRRTYYYNDTRYTSILKRGKMNKSLRIAVCLITLVLFTTPYIATAQTTNTPPLLMITSRDSAYPVLYQILAEGEIASAGGLASKVTIQEQADVRVYVSLANTGGWSQGLIGLLSGSLLRENQYVALEVDADGAPVENGRAFPLTYKAGYFQVPVLLDIPKTLAVFQITTEGGVEVNAQTATPEGKKATLSEASFQIDPEAPFGAIVLECHIAPR